MTKSAGKDGDDAPGSGVAGTTTDATIATVLDGFTLDSGRKRRRKHKRGAGAASTAPPPRQEDEPDLPHHDKTPWPSEEPDPPAEAADPPEPTDHGDLFRVGVFSAQDSHGGPADDYGDPAAMVRPYQWTGGRTKASVHLELETLVSTSKRGSEDSALRTLEHRTVAALCRHPHAVAEVAAKLSVPLGVARVLLSDMAEQGLITVHQTVADDDMAAHLVLMERVLSGLRRL